MNNASKGAPGPVKTVHISWPLHCYGELTLDLMPGMRSLQIHHVRKGVKTSHTVLLFPVVCHCMLTLDTGLEYMFFVLFCFLKYIQYSVTSVNDIF